RHSWCSRACVEEHRSLHDWQYIRRQVEKRDRGVCASCGCDTKKVERILWHSDGLPEGRKMLFGTDRGGRGFWEADHIKQVAEGGTNELANLRTLCVGCHAAETRQ